MLENCFIAKKVSHVQKIFINAISKASVCDDYNINHGMASADFHFFHMNNILTLLSLRFTE